MVLFMTHLQPFTPTAKLAPLYLLFLLFLFHHEDQLYKHQYEDQRT